MTQPQPAEGPAAAELDAQPLQAAKLRSTDSARRLAQLVNGLIDELHVRIVVEKQTISSIQKECDKTRAHEAEMCAKFALLAVYRDALRQHQKTLRFLEGESKLLKRAWKNN